LNCSGFSSFHGPLSNTKVELVIQLRWSTLSSLAERLIQVFRVCVAASLAKGDNMKRITMIVAIALLVVLSARFDTESQTYKSLATIPNLIPEVSKFGTLTNLKDEKGGRLFSKPIQEGFYVRFRVGKGEDRTLYAVGDRVSDPQSSCSTCQKISGAGMTTRDGLYITSGFAFDKGKRTLKAIRTIVNLSKDGSTMYLIEVKNYSDTKLPSLRTEIGKTDNFTAVSGSQALKIKASNDDSRPSFQKRLFSQKEPNITNSNCWPCQPWPMCDLGSVLPDLARATVVCINCGIDGIGMVHDVCLANLEAELIEIRKEGCEHMIMIRGIDARIEKPLFGDPCRDLQLKQESSSGGGRSGNERELSEAAVKRLLTLPVGAAIVLTTEYKVNLPGK